MSDEERAGPDGGSAEDGERRDEGSPARAFRDLGGLSFRLDGGSLVSQRILAVGGSEMTVVVEALDAPAVPAPAGEDAKARLGRLMKSIRIRLSVA